MLKLRKIFENMKLANKFLTVFVLFISVFIMVVIIAFNISFMIYDEKLYEKSIQELDFFAQNINKELDELENLSYMIVMDEVTQQQLDSLRAYEIYDGAYELELNKFKRAMINELNTNNFFKGVTYVYHDEIKFNIGMTTLNTEDDDFKELLESFSKARGGYVTQNPKEEFPYLVAGRDILKYADVSLDYLGTLIFTCDVSALFQNQINELETKNSTFYVYSEDGIIFQSDDEIKIKFDKIDTKNRYELITIDNEKYFMCYLVSSKNNWVYVNIFPYSKIYEQISMVKQSMLIGLLIMFLALLVVMRKVSSAVTKPLENLIQSMRIVENGDFNKAKEVLEESERKDEVGLLTQEFGVALNNIQELIHENYEKQLMLKDVEYRMLQAQMNPHFLYNTLNTVNWLIIGNRNDDAKTMVIQLSEILRASFSKKHYASVEEDLNIAKSYIGIQEHRYKNRIEFEIESKGELSQVQIPLMTIQPLIENSIQHGAEASLRSCKITVKVMIEEKVFIEVADTGIGMSASDLEKVRNFTAQPKGNGIGLKNISERLKIKYHDSEFEIDSTIGKGTIVRIRIPKVLGDENV